jgi:S-adenosylmethionine:tRNA ribosyltransferase-isomerase
MQVQDLKIEDFNYNLPNEKIAFFPLPQRDASKLLVYKNNTIKEDIYTNIAAYIPENSLLIFNNTKVIQARLVFTKDTGGIIEIFILEPNNIDMANAMQQQHKIIVNCMVGGAAKWKNNSILKKTVEINSQTITINASLVKKEVEHFVIKLFWNKEISFAEILIAAGNMPLPPYIKRDTTIEDAERYQTIYAEHNGSVAAPTAGLHFTPTIFKNFITKNIETDYVTLHVGAGTFKPVSSLTVKEHIMHQECITINLSLIEKILFCKELIIAIGTTSLRTLESIYWLGVKVFSNISITKNDFFISQWDAYNMAQNITKENALIALLNWMKENNLHSITTTTQLLIAPTYNFRISKAIVTNFHQPKSTLLLLVAAATNGKWKDLYNYALQNEFRFLSYGDGSLIFI